MNKLAIIDADGLCFQSSKDTLDESIRILDDKIQNIFDKTECTHYIMFISNGKYFRHNIDPEYKASRKRYPSKLKWLKTLKAYLVENYNAQSMNLVESDDLCSYFYNKEPFEKLVDDGNMLKLGIPFACEKIICSPDKDVLNLPGAHFNYTYKIKDESKDKPKETLTDSDFNKGWWVKTNEVDAYKFQWIQVLMGDSSDGVSGLNKIGEKTASKWINECSEGYSKFVLGKYVDHYQNEAIAIYEFQKNYRLLHMLDSNSDFIREVGQIPNFPQIQQVIKPIVEDKIDF